MRRRPRRRLECALQTSAPAPSSSRIFLARVRAMATVLQVGKESPSARAHSPAAAPSCLLIRPPDVRLQQSCSSVSTSTPAPFVRPLAQLDHAPNPTGHLLSRPYQYPSIVSHPPIPIPSCHDRLCQPLCRLSTCCTGAYYTLLALGSRAGGVCIIEIARRSPLRAPAPVHFFFLTCHVRPSHPSSIHVWSREQVRACDPGAERTSREACATLHLPRIRSAHMPAPVPSLL